MIIRFLHDDYPPMPGTGAKDSLAGGSGQDQWSGRQAVILNACSCGYRMRASNKIVTDLALLMG